MTDDLWLRVIKKRFMVGACRRGETDWARPAGRRRSTGSCGHRIRWISLRSMEETLSRIRFLIKHLLQMVSVTLERWETSQSSSLVYSVEIRVFTSTSITHGKCLPTFTADPSDSDLHLPVLHSWGLRALLKVPSSSTLVVLGCDLPTLWSEVQGQCKLSDQTQPKIESQSVSKSRERMNQRKKETGTKRPGWQILKERRD